MKFEGTGFEESRTSLAPVEREQLLVEHLPQVRSIARGIHQRLPAHVPLEDLIHAGVLGLMDAVQKFNPAKNVELKCYAQFRIRGAILDSLREMDWCPRNFRRQAKRVDQARLELEARFGRAPNEQEIAIELDMDLAEFQHLLGDLVGLDHPNQQTDSMEEQSDQEPFSRSARAEEKDPFVLCLQSELKSLIQTALKEFDHRARQVFRLYYLEELTMKEVGAVVGVSQSRVSQIHDFVTTRLRARVKDLVRARSHA
jgi:RNA polymerase sigma factor for flagellar operon FliA